MKYQLIIFDWDGTLYDSAAFIVQSVQSACQELNFRIPDASDVRQAMGLSLERAIESYLPELSKTDIDCLGQKFRENLMTPELGKANLFEGALEVLDKLKEMGCWLAIATGKARESLDFELDRCCVQDYFLATRSASETQSKPHPQMLFEILDELGMGVNDALMVGDTEHDILTACNAKMDVLAVSYGAHDEEQLLKHPIKGCLKDIRDLPDWLKKAHF